MRLSHERTHCLISGRRADTGSAIAKKITEGGLRIALLARTERGRLVDLEKELVTAKGLPCDNSPIPDPK